LVKYRHDNRIGHISGSNFQFNNKRGTSDYYFSRLYNVWGWATWKRVWLKYDINMENLEEAIKNDFLNNVTDNLYHKDYLYKCFEATKSNKINTWDYQYTYSNSIQGLLSIFPNNNMISNIGFNEKGTHTLSNNHPFSNLSHVLLPKILIHPKFFISNKPADEFTLSTEIPSLFVRILKKYRGILIIKIKSFLKIY